MRRDVNLAVAQPFDEFLRRDVDQFQLVYAFQHRIGDRFADDDAGDLGDDVVQAFEVLDIERAPDVDAGGQKFLDVLPAFDVPGAVGIGVGQFIDENPLGVPFQGGVQIEFMQDNVAVGKLERRDDFESFEQGFGVGPAVRFDVADDNVDPFGLVAAGSFQHGIGLADAGSVAEENLQLSAGRGLHRLELGPTGCRDRVAWWPFR